MSELRIVEIDRVHTFPSGQTRVYVRVKCVCGNDFVTQRTYITTGHTRSCGCSWFDTREKLKTHPAYGIWADIKKRCYNKNCKAYPNYGGRGISVCNEWLNDSIAFTTWCNANGYQKGLEIDRVNNDGDYSPSNCRFVTRTINSQNRRSPNQISGSGYRGVTKKSVFTWRAMITVNKKAIIIGSYDDPVDAAIAYNEYVIKNKLPHLLNELTQDQLDGYL